MLFDVLNESDDLFVGAFQECQQRRDRLIDVAQLREQECSRFFGLTASLTLDQPSRRLLGAPEELAQRLLDCFASQKDDALVLCCFLDDATK